MKSLPIPLLTFLAAQVGAAVWWGAQIEKIRQVVREEIYIQLVNNWPKSSGPVKGLTVPKQDYRQTTPQR